MKDLLKEVNRMGRHLYKTENLFKHKPKDVYVDYQCENYTGVLKRRINAGKITLGAKA